MPTVTLRTIIESLSKLPVALKRETVEGGNKEVMAEILGTTGVQKYPPATDANQPPTPYYIRGRGTQLKSRNLGNSERYGTRWSTKTSGYTTIAENTASYGQHLVGENQASAMGKIGWRRIVDVMREKKALIEDIYNKWVERAIKKVGL